MHPELELLPTFRIVRVLDSEPVCFEGIFGEDVVVKRGWWGYLITHDFVLIEGKWKSADQSTRMASFAPIDAASSQSIKPGELYRFIDGYWGERVALVLDRSQTWTRNEYKAKNAGDHEHCAICWKAISQDVERFGYVSSGNKWICDRCYEEYVRPCRISFLDDKAAAQVREG